MYRIGQITRDQVTSYLNKQNYRQDLLDTEDTIITFKDPCLFLTGVNVLSALYTYYLKFKIKQSNTYAQDFTVKLKNNKSSQSIKTLNVKKGNSYTTFELIFTPNMTYNQIVFELQRLNIDFSGTNRVIDLEVINFSRINNIIETYLSSKYSGLTNLKKIGIQGRTGLLFTINGEEIRIGKSGIYELYHKDIIISYLGFVIDSNNTDSFILDFKY